MPDINEKMPDSADEVPDTTGKVPDSADKVPDTTDKAPDNVQEIYKYVLKKEGVSRSTIYVKIRKRDKAAWP